MKEPVGLFRMSDRWFVVVVFRQIALVMSSVIMEKKYSSKDGVFRGKKAREI
jgi:hypothetical protein